ncbi:MAG TPA: DUF1223 domain-containing protein [Caulobacteraceae bacterium]|nr:DUF1223 domain-containing protein [Caulobacteraceae bacterium]
MALRAFAAALLLAACSAQSAGLGASHGPMVVELFTSQGCSSCPPAEANLAAVADRPDVIALSFGVTYWDQLGWKDAFAQPAFTQRQWDYAHAFGQGDVYTPEIVVDGRKPGVGTGKSDFAALIGYGASTKLAGPAIALTSDRATIAAGPRPSTPADVWLVRFDPRVIRTPVGRGENAGKTLPQRDVVRQLSRLGGWTGAAASFRLSPPSDPAWRAAILVQAPRGGPILAAARS